MYSHMGFIVKDKKEAKDGGRGRRERGRLKHKDNHQVRRTWEMPAVTGEVVDRYALNPS